MKKKIVINEIVKFILKGIIVFAVISFIAYSLNIPIENMIEPIEKATPVILVILIIIMLWLKILERKKNKTKIKK